jgi:SagB-type dehydrogenase family enzyme
MLAMPTPEAETASQILHRLTSYGPYDAEHPDAIWDPPVEDPRVVQDLVVNDTDRLPWFYKRYDEDLPTVPLPRTWPTSDPSTVAVLAGTAEPPRREPDVEHLGRLLHLSAGVVRTTVRPYVTWLFRAAGSAGGRFPLEVYVAIPEGTALPAGVHWYHPEAHALVRIAPAPRGEAPTIVVTGVPWRTGWRYRERGYRHTYWDAGTMLSQVLAVAASAGHEPSLCTRFPDADVASLVGADGVHEWPVAVVTLGDGSRATDPMGEAAVGRIDSAPVEFPLATAAQHAGDHDAWGPSWEVGEPVEVPITQSPPIDEVIRTRGSTRLMDGSRSLPLDVLRTSMLAAMRGIDLPHLVAAHAIDGLAPGIYRWPDLASPRRAGDQRDALYRLALEQGLAQDAAFVAVGLADVAALDDRGYREAQLGAGLVEGRLHLLAYALGAGACGMTFTDAEIPTLLGERLDGLLLTCVGVPEYTSTAGGPPGAPVEVKLITPRSS